MKGGKLSKLWLPDTHKPPFILTYPIFLEHYLYPSLMALFHKSFFLCIHVKLLSIQLFIQELYLVFLHFKPFPFCSIHPPGVPLYLHTFLKGHY